MRREPIVTAISVSAAQFFAGGSEKRDLGALKVVPHRDALWLLPENMIEGAYVRTGQIVQGRDEQDVDHPFTHPQLIDDIQRGRLPHRRVVTILGSALGLLSNSDELTQQLQPLHSAGLGPLIGLPTLIAAIGAALHAGLGQVGQTAAEHHTNQGQDRDPHLYLHEAIHTKRSTCSAAFPSDWRLASQGASLRPSSPTPLSSSEWMVEPHVLARTGATVETHQRRTVTNYLRLRELAPDLPFIPVVQDDTASSYERCADLYERSGVDLAELPLVGVGSVCRRQHRAEVEQIMRSLAARGLRLHGFGIKTTGLARYATALASADSMAWSFRGRHVPGCTPSHRTEANCLRFALAWHDRLLRSLEGGQSDGGVSPPPNRDWSVVPRRRRGRAVCRADDPDSCAARSCWSGTQVGKAA